jgi:hypothetical protein
MPFKVKNIQVYWKKYPNVTHRKNIPGRNIQGYWKKYPYITYGKNVPGKNIQGCRQNVISTFCLISN